MWNNANFRPALQRELEVVNPSVCDGTNPLRVRLANVTHDQWVRVKRGLHNVLCTTFSVPWDVPGFTMMFYVAPFVEFLLYNTYFYFT